MRPLVRGGVFKSGAVMGAKTEKRSWLVSLLLSLPLPSSGRGRLGRASLGRWGAACVQPLRRSGVVRPGGPWPPGPPCLGRASCWRLPGGGGPPPSLLGAAFGSAPLGPLGGGVSKLETFLRRRSLVAGATWLKVYSNVKQLT